MSPEFVARIDAHLRMDPGTLAARKLGPDAYPGEIADASYALTPQWLADFQRLILDGGDRSQFLAGGDYHAMILAEGFQPIGSVPMVTADENHIVESYFREDGLASVLVMDPVTAKVSRAFLLYNWVLADDLTVAWRAAMAREQAEMDSGLDIWGDEQLRARFLRMLDIRSGLDQESGGRWHDHQGRFIYAGMNEVQYGFKYHLARITGNPEGRLLNPWVRFPSPLLHLFFSPRIAPGIAQAAPWMAALLTEVQEQTLYAPAEE